MLHLTLKQASLALGHTVLFADGHSDEPLAASTLPWQLVALLLCLATLSIVAAILYPDVFGAPFEQF